MQAKFEALERIHEQLEERKELVDRQAAAASKEATRLADELNELKEAKDATDHALARVQAELQKLQERLQVAQTEGEDEKAAVATLRDEVARLETALREAEARCEQLTEEKCGAAAEALSRAQELEQKEHELRQTNAVLEQTKQDVAKLEAAYSENAANLQAARADSENHLQQIAELQAQVAALQAEKDELVGAGDLLQRVRELTAELDKTVGEKNHWMKKAESLTKDMQKMLKQASNKPGPAAAAAAAAASPDEIARLLARIEVRVWFLSSSSRSLIANNNHICLNCAGAGATVQRVPGGDAPGDGASRSDRYTHHSLIVLGLSWEGIFAVNCRV